ncbi:abortive infection system antitoxin AbiGi family protein [Solimonas marina]|uniref:Uncharacterized protein n=1 Tax=Solimonas marina TaxID=2714601 RepID=A0A970BBT3_9GAMM|nr:abortive infection system antitoxin AbiGi family protein [Solimonas marina]NKF24801.1 hypothetical protein [Solimonas marina]
MKRKYINEALMHWTGRGKSDIDAYSALESICVDRILRLTFCPNYVQPSLDSKTAMVCFTEIPLEHSAEHCGLFGRFGIAFKKSAMIEYGANPVFYTTAKHLVRIKHISTLLERMKDLEKDREWRQDIEPYRFSEDETVAMMEVLGLLQEYSYKNNDGTDYVTYYQREWRLTFDVLPFAEGSTPHTAGTSCFYIRNGTSYQVFKFKDADVAYIVVPEDFEQKAKALAASMACDVKVYEREVA